MDDNYLELQKQINELKAEVERLKTLELNYVSKLAVGSTTVPAAGGLSVVAGVASSGAGTPIYLNAGGGGSGEDGGNVHIGAGQNGSGGDNGNIRLGIANASGTGLQATKLEITPAGATYIYGPLYVDYSMLWQRNVTEVALNLMLNDGASQEKVWRWDVYGNYINLDTVNDNYTAATTAVRFYRTGNQATDVAFLGTGDVYSTTWTDWTSSASISGFASLSTSRIFYKRIGKLVFVDFMLVGTANANSKYFNLPYQHSSTYTSTFPISGQYGANFVSTGIGYIDVSGTGVGFYVRIDGAAFPTSGDLQLRGQFFYEAA